MGRSWSALVSWATATATLVTGLAVAVCQVPPDNLLGVDAYSRVFSVHGASSLAVLPLLLVPLAKSEWLTAPRLRGAALGLVIAGAVVLGLADVLAGVLGRRASLLAAPLGALVQSAGALVFAIAIVRHGNEPNAARFSRAAALVWLAGWLSLRIGLPAIVAELSTPTDAFFFDPHSMLMLLDRAGPTLSICIALGATAALALSSAPKVGALVTSAVACALGLLGAALVDPAALFLALPAGVVFGVQAFAAARAAPSRWKRWVRRAQAVVFIEALLLRGMLTLMDPSLHFHDTLFPVGAMHLAFFAAAFGWLDTCSPKEERSGAIGLSAILAGGHGLVLAHLVLGSQGNPGRYAAYLEEQEGWLVLHGLAAVAGVILLVGCVTVALSMKDRERPGSF